MPDDLAALSDQDLHARAAPLRDEVRLIQQQLADDRDAVFTRGTSWRARALWRLRRTRDELRPVNAEIQRRRDAADAARREARREAMALEAARSVEKSRRLYAERFRAAAERVLPPDTYTRIVAAMEPAP